MRPGDCGTPGPDNSCLRREGWSTRVEQRPAKPRTRTFTAGSGKKSGCLPNAGPGSLESLHLCQKKAVPDTLEGPTSSLPLPFLRKRPLRTDLDAATTQNAAFPADHELPVLIEREYFLGADTDTGSAINATALVKRDDIF